MANHRSLLSASRAALLAAAFVAAGHPALADTSQPEPVPARSFSGAYLAAGAARSDNDFAAAARYFGEALRFDPGNELLERELLLTLVSSGQLDDALDLAERMKDVPDIERVSRVVLGIDALRKGDYAGADAVLQLSADNDLERLLTGVMRAWAKAGAGETDAALDILDTLNGPEWYNLFVSYHTGLIQKVSGNGDAALERLRAASEDTAGAAASPLTYLRLAAAHARLEAEQGDTEAAIAAIDRGLEVAPTNPVLLALRDNLDDTTLIESPVTGPAEGAAEILLNLGSAINRDGAEEFATLYLEMARALAPKNANVLFELGSIAERMGQPEKAIRYYDQVPDQSALKRISALQQGLNLADLDRNEEAISTLEELVAQNPDDYRGYLALGGVHAAEEDYEAAALTYEKALDFIDNEEPAFWPLHYRLAIAYERMGEWPKAEERFKYTLELSPGQPDVLNYLGYSWIDMNMNLEEGLEMIREAVAARPRSGYIVDSLGWAYYRLGRFEEAVAELEKAADLRPRDPTITDHLGDAYWRVGRKLEATYQWSTALAFEPDEELEVSIMTKISAANTQGMVPQIATSIADDEEARQAASDGTTDESDGG